MIFDGAAQTADKVTASTLINEPFDEADGQGCCSSLDLPAGWTREPSAGFGWLAGDNSGSNGEAYRWFDSADAWLFTAPVTLFTDVTYQVSYDYKQLFGGATDTVSVYIGSAANSGSMTTQVSATPNFSSTSYATQSDNFTVGSSGTYYLGIRGQQVAGAGYVNVDNVLLTGSQPLTFHDLQVSATTAATFNQDVVVQNDLTTSSGGTMDINGWTVSVEGSVTNDGALRDTRDAPNGIATPFLTIQNAAATLTKYQGLVLTPTGGNMGSTTVTVKGNRTCTTDPTSATVRRCFDITPTTSNAATIRFYYLAAEANGNAENGTSVYHWTGSGWSMEGGAYSYSSGGDPRFVEVTGVSSFSPFVLDDIAPTAVTHSQSRVAQTGSDWVPLAGLLLLLGTFAALRRRQHLLRRATRGAK